jgi:hypothetical protein
LHFYYYRITVKFNVNGSLDTPEESEFEQETESEKAKDQQELPVNLESLIYYVLKFNLSLFLNVLFYI